MSEPKLEINSKEEVAYKLYRECDYGRGTNEEKLKLYEACLKVVQGNSALRALAESK